MITLQYISDSTIEFTHESTTFTIFGESTAKEQISLLQHPEDMPSNVRISWPGEYDFSGIAVTGIGQNEDSTVSYVLHVDHLGIAFISSPLQDWSGHDIETLSTVDILVIPAGPAKLVQKLVEDLDPRVLVVFPGKNPEHMSETLQITGAMGKEVQSVYKLKGALPMEGRENVILGA